MMPATEPTHQWCPKCNAMLPAYLKRCPRCKANMRGGGMQTFREIMQLAGVMIAVGIIPFIIIFAIGIICIQSMD